jgi:hypothetical protein
VILQEEVKAMIQLRSKTSEEFTEKERELAALTAPLLTFNIGKEKSDCAGKNTG